jgi:hypothetical protein
VSNGRRKKNSVDVKQQREPVSFPSFLYVFSILVMALGAAVIFLMPVGYDSAVKQHAAKSWPVAQGTVVQSSVREREDHTDDSKTMYNAAVSTEYMVDGRRHRINEIYFSQSNSWSAPSYRAQRTARKYKKGTQVAVYYDPEYPGIATLEPGMKPWNYGIIGSGIGIFLIGLLAFWFALRNTYRFIRQYFVTSSET